jgi:hypothetical protein
MADSYISATNGRVRGIPAAEPTLQIVFDVEAAGLPDGASALFFLTGSVRADSGRTLSLGTATPSAQQLGYPARTAGAPHYTTQLTMSWTLSDAAIERIEKLRDGGSLTVCPHLEYALISPGTSLPNWPEPHRPIRVPSPGPSNEIRVDAHSWAQDVLEQWDLAAAVSLVVALPAGTATDEHKTIARRLATAKQLLRIGTPDELKASIAASREACELLRDMLPAAVASSSRQRDLGEREAVILDKVRDLAQALFNYDSAAAHPDPHLRHITWTREHAVLALGTATSLAQLIFART